jgi:hypothetical protein
VPASIAVGIQPIGPAAWLQDPTPVIQLVLNDNPDSAFGTVGCTHFSASLPAPAAIWLLGSALGLLGWMRRKST